MEVTLLNASDDDYIIDFMMVDVVNCGTASVTIIGETDIEVEDLELFLLSISVNDLVYEIGVHSIATIYIKGAEPGIKLLYKS